MLSYKQRYLESKEKYIQLKLQNDIQDGGLFKKMTEEDLEYLVDKKFMADNLTYTVNGKKYKVEKIPYMRNEEGIGFMQIFSQSDIYTFGKTFVPFITDVINKDASSTETFFEKYRKMVLEQKHFIDGNFLSGIAQAINGKAFDSNPAKLTDKQKQAWLNYLSYFHELSKELDLEDVPKCTPEDIKCYDSKSVLESRKSYDENKQCLEKTKRYLVHKKNFDKKIQFLIKYQDALFPNHRTFLEQFII